MLKKLWSDDGGFIISTELVLIATILVIGIVVGLSNVRNAVNSELTEVARAISSIDQTYNYCGQSGCCSFVAGSSVTDTVTLATLKNVAPVATNINVDACAP